MVLYIESFMEYKAYTIVVIESLLLQTYRLGLYIESYIKYKSYTTVFIESYLP